VLSLFSNLKGVYSALGSPTQKETLKVIPLRFPEKL